MHLAGRGVNGIAIVIVRSLAMVASRGRHVFLSS